MAKTVLITGSSSGIGQSTAKYFHEKGWNVAATMRKPENDKALSGLENLKLYQLDVTSTESIRNAIKQTIQDFGEIDVIVNNAGYGLFGPFESATEEQISNQFNTNVFGVMQVTKNILPYFREKKSGLIINITSIGGLVTLPLNSVYHAAKFAIEGFSEALNYELNPLNIRVKIVEPGGVATDFSGRSLDNTIANPIDDYKPVIETVMKAFTGNRANYSTPEYIAEAIFTAATDNKEQLRYVTGNDAEYIYKTRRSVSQEEYYDMTKERFGLK